MADENFQVVVDGKPVAPEHNQRIQAALKQTLQAELQKQRSELGFDDTSAFGSGHGSASNSVST